MPEKSILPSPKQSKRAPPRKPKVQKDTELQGPKDEDVDMLHSKVEIKAPSKRMADVTKARPSTTTTKDNVQGESNVNANTPAAQHPVIDALMTIWASDNNQPDPAPASTAATPENRVSEHAKLEKEDEAPVAVKNLQKAEQPVLLVDAEISSQGNAVLPIEDQHNMRPAPPTATNVATLDNRVSDHGKLEKEAEVSVVVKECENVVSLIGDKGNSFRGDAEVDSTVNILVTLPNADTVTTNTLKFTHIDSKKTQQLEAMMREMKMKRCNRAEDANDQPGNNQEVVTPEATCINFATIDRNENLTSSQKEDVVQIPNMLADDNTCSEESESKLEENRRKEFLKYVGTEMYKEPKIPIFEVPEFLDISTPMRARHDSHAIMNNIPQIEPSMDGLGTVHDAILRPECQKILAEMEPKLIPKKRKGVRFVDQKEKRSKVEETNVPSPSRYRTSKSVEEVYNMVCQHGWKNAPKDPFNKEIVIDLDDIYVSLGDLAESVRPRNKLYTTIAEIGINIIKRENQNPKKVIMPLRIASYLIEDRDNLKEVTRCFENSPSNRLDHKDIV
ncbi:hypothetical protein ACQ4PT_015145 [Festuca glaucescens]